MPKVSRRRGDGGGLTQNTLGGFVNCKIVLVYDNLWVLAGTAVDDKLAKPPSEENVVGVANVEPSPHHLHIIDANAAQLHSHHRDHCVVIGVVSCLTRVTGALYDMRGHRALLYNHRTTRH